MKNAIDKIMILEKFNHENKASLGSKSLCLPYQKVHLDLVVKRPPIGWKVCLVSKNAIDKKESSRSKNLLKVKKIVTTIKNSP